ncbi:hypothetical protein YASMINEVIRUS_831 [Yasminevirus sp. GU-2018]|uniref:Uncharacterized protein n=1 Tax=Yasminevirus sp. GU-2018 TaxID=2420051 RepID=A0A5K0U8I4_9VIRU|nr:hypothetical protein YASMINEVIRUS_831 [Yasminevirus sp. GU-2018]
MSKYSQKLESFLSSALTFHNKKSGSRQNNLLSINADADIISNPVIKNILDCATNAYSSQHNVKVVENGSIKQIHSRDSYPLSYIFFKCLYEVDMLKHVVGYPPDITDLHTFMSWHRENIDHVNFDKLHKLMEELNDDEVYEELKLVYQLMFKTTGVRSQLHDSIYSNRFISVDVQYDLESTDLSYAKYMIDGKHTVLIFAPHGKQMPDIETVAIVIDTMERLAKSAGDNSPAPVNLTILYSDQKKAIPNVSELFTVNDNQKDNNGTRIDEDVDTDHMKDELDVRPIVDVLCCDNINSGSTYPGRSIVCWRREELHKVLIHELFHYHKFDFYTSDPFYTKLEDGVNVPRITGSDSINECYTEACAILIMTVLRFVFLNKVQSTDVNRIKREFNTFFYESLRTELMFIMFQIAKIIVSFGGGSFNDYETGQIVIKQTTSFRSYFVIKLVLLSNLGAMLRLIESSLYVSGERLEEFRDVINSSWESFTKSDNVDLINSFIDISERAYRDGTDSWVFRTCRMSVNDVLLK